MIKKIIGVGIILIAVTSVIFGSCSGSGDMDFHSAEQGEYSLKEGTGMDQSGESQETEADSSVKQQTSESDPAKEQEEPLCVYVCGQVRCPGVYELEQGKRICDAIDAAGGMTGDAAQDYWNLAEVLNDGQMIYVPSEKEAKERLTALPGTSASDEVKGDGKVNINTADKEELMTISGIGEGRAGAIISYREKNGAFGCIEDLTQVSGIGDALFNNIKDMIKVY